MAEIRILDDDIIRVYELGKPRSAENLIATLFWGDNVTVVGNAGGQYKVEMSRREWNSNTNHYETKIRTGTLPQKTRFRETPYAFHVDESDVVFEPETRIN